jgi:hypothetical protein
MDVGNLLTHNVEVVVSQWQNSFDVIVECDYCNAVRRASDSNEFRDGAANRGHWPAAHRARTIDNEGNIKGCAINVGRWGSSEFKQHIHDLVVLREDDGLVKGD